MAKESNIEPDGYTVRSSAGKSSPNGGQDKLTENHYGGKKQSTPKNGKSILPNHIRASIGSHDVASLRRNSTGKPSSSDHGGSFSPNYLRASTGSCHDFCKYGRKHAFEAKPWNPVPKRVIKPAPNREDPTEFGVSVERKMTTAVKSKASPVSKASSNFSSIVQQEASSPSRKDEVSARQALFNEKKIAQTEKKKNFSGKRAPVRPKNAVFKPLSSPDISGLNDSRNSEFKIAQRAGTSKPAVKKITASPVASLSAKPSVDRVTSLNVKQYRNLKLVSPLKNQNRVSKAKAQQSKKEKIREKTLHVIEVETDNTTLESANNGSTIYSPPSPMSPSLPKSPSLSFHEEELQEESEYSDTEVDEAYDSLSEINEGDDLQKVETSEENRKRLPRNPRVDLSDKDCAPEKLKFRRGKVVDLRSENGGPRRLRFRRGRVLGDNLDSQADVGRRRFRKKGAEDETMSANLDSEKVVLKHQDVQGKKDAQGLFNNVIEETASKLVESRKSKVKALVGAFETVISLQESNPST